MHCQWAFRSTTAATVLAVVFATACLHAPSAHAEASPSTIYRCTQTDGGMGYQDFPCNGGVVVQIRPGVANPDEIARLARAQEAFERSAAARRADELTALRREELMLRRQELDATTQSGADASGQDSVYYPAYGFGGYADGRRSSHTLRHNNRGAQRHVASTGRVPAVIHRPHR